MARATSHCLPQGCVCRWCEGNERLAGTLTERTSTMKPLNRIGSMGCGGVGSPRTRSVSSIISASVRAGCDCSGGNANLLAGGGPAGRAATGVGAILLHPRSPANTQICIYNGDHFGPDGNIVECRVHVAFHRLPTICTPAEGRGREIIVIINVFCEGKAPCSPPPIYICESTSEPLQFSCFGMQFTLSLYLPAFNGDGLVAAWGNMIRVPDSDNPCGHYVRLDIG